MSTTIDAFEQKIWKCNSWSDNIKNSEIREKFSPLTD